MCNNGLFVKHYFIEILSRFIRFVRVADSQGNLYFHGVVLAEMKKSVVYIVDLQLDRHGVVVEAQCECAAGQGPSAHCKHVGAVLYSLYAIQHSSKLLYEETCTQVRA